MMIEQKNPEFINIMKCRPILDFTAVLEKCVKLIPPKSLSSRQTSKNIDLKDYVL